MLWVLVAASLYTLSKALSSGMSRVLTWSSPWNPAAGRSHGNSDTTVHPWWKLGVCLLEALMTDMASFSPWCPGMETWGGRLASRSETCGTTWVSSWLSSWGWSEHLEFPLCSDTGPIFQCWRNVCVLACVHVETMVPSLFLRTAHRIFEQDLSLTCHLPSWSGTCVSGPKDPLFSTCPALGLHAWATLPRFVLYGSGFELRSSSWLHGRYFTN